MEGDFHLESAARTVACAAGVVSACCCGAYMSAAETAITGASRPRMHRLAQQGNKRAALVNGLLDRKDETVSAVLLGNSVVNILSASLTTAVLTALFGAAGIVYATVAVGVMVVIFAEVMPKTWALLRADRVALMLAPSIVLTLKILGPWRAPSPGSRAFSSGCWRACRPRAGDGGARRTPARRDRAARRRPDGRGRACREGDAALGARPRRPHGRRRHDPSRQRRADRRRPAHGVDRAAQMLAAPYTRIPVYRGEPTTSSASSTPRTCSARSSAAGGPSSGQARRRHDAALVHSRIDDPVRPAPGLPRPPRAFRHRRRRIWRAARHRHPRGHHRGDHRRHRGRARRHQARRRSGARTAACSARATCRSTTSTASSAGACRRTAPSPSPAWCCTRRGASPKSARPMHFTDSASKF